jgi:hypothetical protein
LNVVRATRTCALASFGGLVLVNWRSEVIRDDVEAVIALRKSMLADNTFVGSIQIAEPGLPVPDEALRETARRAMKARQENQSAIALVILGEGFGASAIRSVGTAVFALRGAPTRLFASSDEAATWMVEKMRAYHDAQALAEACRTLRAA